MSAIKEWALTSGAGRGLGRVGWPQAPAELHAVDGAAERKPWRWRRLIDADGLPPQVGEAETDNDCIRRVEAALEADAAAAEEAERKARAAALAEIHLTGEPR